MNALHKLHSWGYVTLGHDTLSLFSHFFIYTDMQLSYRLGNITGIIIIKK